MTKLRTFYVSATTDYGQKFVGTGPLRHNGDLDVSLYASVNGQKKEILSIICRVDDQGVSHINVHVDDHDHVVGNDPGRIKWELKR